MTKYLFLGDYVDRGNYGVEIILTLFALKIAYPNLIFLLRGNHECRQMTSAHNFREECIYKYDQEIYDMIMDSFDQLPLGAIINGQFLALHGGISPELESALDLNKADRFREPPQLGILCDVLWSDPVDNDTGLQPGMWMPNPSRGCSYYFGYYHQLQRHQHLSEKERTAQSHSRSRGAIRGLQGLCLAKHRLSTGCDPLLGTELLRLLCE